MHVVAISVLKKCTDLVVGHLQRRTGLFGRFAGVCAVVGALGVMQRFGHRRAWQASWQCHAILVEW